MNVWCGTCGQLTSDWRTPSQGQRAAVNSEAPSCSQAQETCPYHDKLCSVHLCRPALTAGERLACRKAPLLRTFTMHHHLSDRPRLATNYKPKHAQHSIRQAGCSKSRTHRLACDLRTASPSRILNLRCNINVHIHIHNKKYTYTLAYNVYMRHHAASLVASWVRRNSVLNEKLPEACSGSRRKKAVPNNVIW